LMEKRSRTCSRRNWISSRIGYEGKMKMMKTPINIIISTLLTKLIQKR
jgi:hypothetical protein